MSRPTETLVSLFRDTVARHPATIALRSIDGRVNWTWAEYDHRARRLAAGLSALGVGPGDTVALLMSNRPEWQLTDLAALMTGATPFSLYVTAPFEESMTLARRAGARVLVADPWLVDEQKHPSDIQVVLTEPDGSGRPTIAALSTVPDVDIASLSPADAATLIFTSGTTGKPKIVELSHRAVIFVARALDAVVPLDGGRTVSYLPHAHIVDRIVGHYLGLVAGATVTNVHAPTPIFDALPQVRPTIFTSVPRLWQRLEKTLRKADATADIRAEVGLDAAQWLITGSAPLPRATHEFFADRGMPLHDLWGLSETAALATISRPGEHRIGTVGRALPGTRIRLAADGEILVHGPHLANGYRNDPVATAEAFDADGWFHTGDIGEFYADELAIIDRKKDIIISAGGENMSPAYIESVLSSSPLIEQAVVIGDGKPFNVALIVPNFDLLAEQGFNGSPERVARDQRIVELIAQAVEDANESLSKAERIRHHALVSTPFTTQGGELTQTLKLRRRTVGEKHADVIAELYPNAEAPKLGTSSSFG